MTNEERQRLEDDVRMYFHNAAVIAKAEERNRYRLETRSHGVRLTPDLTPHDLRLAVDTLASAKKAWYDIDHGYVKYQNLTDADARMFGRHRSNLDYDMLWQIDRAMPRMRFTIRKRWDDTAPYVEVPREEAQDMLARDHSEDDFEYGERAICDLIERAALKGKAMIETLHNEVRARVERTN